MAGISCGGCRRQSGRLVLKSPTHSFRIRALAQGFPSGSFVWLVRDPVETFLSNRKMWLAMFERYAFWDWSSTVLDDFLLCAFAKEADSLSLATSLLPKERLVVVDFDRLVKTPLDTMQCLNRHLQLGAWNEMQPAIAQISAKKTNYQADVYRPKLLPSLFANVAQELRTVQQNASVSHGLEGPADNWTF